VGVETDTVSVATETRLECRTMRTRTRMPLVDTDPSSLIGTDPGFGVKVADKALDAPFLREALPAFSHQGMILDLGLVIERICRSADFGYVQVDTGTYNDHDEITTEIVFHADLSVRRSRCLEIRVRVYKTRDENVNIRIERTEFFKETSSIEELWLSVRPYDGRNHRPDRDMECRFIRQIRNLF
jgi:hypothetical protein